MVSAETGNGQLKILFSPYFLCLALLWALCLVQAIGAWRIGRGLRALSVACFLIVIVLTLLSLPLVDAYLSTRLEMKDAYENICPVDAVVVLAGGYYGSRNPEDRMLAGESAGRVLKGVEIYKRCDSRILIMSGGTDGDEGHEESFLMRDLATRLGVPSERIVTESASRNTREHAINLCRGDAVGLDDVIAVVTSPWHLKRAMVEFRRYFRNARPVASYDRRTGVIFSVQSLIPQASVLSETLLMIHEYMGSLWYWLLNRYPGIVNESGCQRT